MIRNRNRQVCATLTARICMWLTEKLGRLALSSSVYNFVQLYICSWRHKVKFGFFPPTVICKYAEQG